MQDKCMSRCEEVGIVSVLIWIYKKRTSKCRSSPDSASNKLEWSCWNLLACCSHTNDDRLSPTLVTGLQSCSLEHSTTYTKVIDPSPTPTLMTGLQSCSLEHRHSTTYTKVTDPSPTPSLMTGLQSCSLEHRHSTTYTKVTDPSPTPPLVTGHKCCSLEHRYSTTNIHTWRWQRPPPPFSNPCLPSVTQPQHNHTQRWQPPSPHPFWDVSWAALCNTATAQPYTKVTTPPPPTPFEMSPELLSVTQPQHNHTQRWQPPLPPPLLRCLLSCSL